MRPAVRHRFPIVVFLMGPTASGKTDFAVELLRHLAGEIVSVDSAMVYRGLDIGTAKPDAATLARAPHRLIDICEPNEVYSAARFRADALEAIEDIAAAGRVPLLVGGTMLYFRALEHGLAELPGADSAVRERLERALQEEGLPALHRRLAVIDPRAAGRIHPNDPQRTLRALEVWELTGRPLSELQAEQRRTAPPFRVLKLVCAATERAALRERIALRFDAMLERGLVAEVAGLLARPELTPELPALRMVGYRQVAAHLRGSYGREEMTRRAVHATRQLAKRQMTWLRSESAAYWFDPAGAAAREAAKRWLGDQLSVPTI